jgi:hypothetical protein
LDSGVATRRERAGPGQVHADRVRVGRGGARPRRRVQLGNRQVRLEDCADHGRAGLLGRHPPRRLRAVLDARPLGDPRRLKDAFTGKKPANGTATANTLSAVSQFDQNQRAALADMVQKAMVKQGFAAPADDKELAGLQTGLRNAFDAAFENIRAAA